MLAQAASITQKTQKIRLLKGHYPYSRGQLLNKVGF